MAKELTEKQKYIIRTVNNYFKAHGITHGEIAERLGYASKNVVDNRLSYGTFGEKAARKWAAEFGFNERFLIEGKGQLIEKSSSYRKILNENEQLKAIVRIQKTIIDKKLKQETP